MAYRAGSKIQGLVTISGMVALIGAVLLDGDATFEVWATKLSVLQSMVPRVSIIRNEDSTIIRYEHLKFVPTTPIPSDEGIILSPNAKQVPSKNPRRKPFNDKDWIFDTGATTHVCGNRSLLHRYDRLNPSSNRLHTGAVGYFGPNPIAIVGAGDVTVDLPVHQPPAAALSVLNSSREKELLIVQRITIKNVMHIPDAGVNLISWSQLKRTRGLDLQLVEENDGSLVVQNKNKPLMRFILRDGLYFLEQARATPEADAN